MPDDVGKGSGRSIKGLNLVDALCYCQDELVKFGGHELAAGLSVTRANLDAFRRKINEYATETLSEENMIPTIDADLEISLSNVNLALVDDLRILEPYGVGNPVPSFVLKDITLTEIAPVSEGKHTRMAFADGKNVVVGMFFSCNPSSLDLYVGDKVDVLFNLDVNEWSGRRNAQLIIRDIKQSEALRSHYNAQVKRFSEIWSGARFSQEENVIPTRDDFANVYRFLVSSVRMGNDTLSVRDMLYKMSGLKGNNIDYIKLSIIIKVMQELNILGIIEIGEDVYRFSMQYRSGKAELEKSNLLRRLRSQQNM